MPALSAQDGSLAANDKVTLAKLVKLGLSTADQAYPMSAQMLAANGLSTGAIVALVRAPLARLQDEQGQEIRPQGFVAKAVTVFAGGAAEITLSTDLAA
jgi:hypothetical protein